MDHHGLSKHLGSISNSSPVRFAHEIQSFRAAVWRVGKTLIKTFGKGKTAGKLATLSVATSECWKSEDGTQKDYTYWDVAFKCAALKLMCAERATSLSSRPPSLPGPQAWSRKARGFA
jgi:hypothetical protein